MRSVRLTTCKKVGASGNSLTLNVTRELRQLGLDRGDAVRVTLEVPEAERTLETMSGAEVTVRDGVLTLRGRRDTPMPVDVKDGQALASALRTCADGELNHAVKVSGVTVTPVTDEFEGVATEISAGGATVRLTYDEAMALADMVEAA